MRIGNRFPIRKFFPTIKSYRLKNYLTDNPDAYLTEIASEFGCHPTTIHYALKAMGYTRKKRITPTMNKTQKK